MALNNFDYQISWSDFVTLFARPAGQNEDAEIFIGFKPEYEYTGNKRAVVIDKLDIDIATVSSKCWVMNTANTNTSLLKHEQGHYDITALAARDLYNKVFGLSAPSANALSKKVDKLQADIQTKLNLANKRYDNQTDHSRNEKIQQSWDQKIDAIKKNPKGRIDDLP